MENKEYNNRKIYCLRDVSESIQKVIAQNYVKDFYVQAEIAKLNYYPQSGHCYPDLVDKKDNRILAQMRGMIWSKDYRSIAEKFKTVTGNELGDGLKILFLASLNYHPTYGISLNIKDIIPEFSLGEMVKEKEKTIQRLKVEKIFELNKAKDLPLFPKNIAIISVSTSKGYHDYQSIIAPYEAKYRLNQVLFPALLQGDGAVKSIMDQLSVIRQYAQVFDFVIILRGGGGDVGLNCYDHYDLAKEIATFPLPVITGIGHSTNQSVVDLVANYSSITPTNTANFVIQLIENYSGELHDFEQSLVKRSMQIIKQHENKLLALAEKIETNIDRNIVKEKQKLLRLAQLLEQLSKKGITEQQAALTLLSEKIKLLDPKHILQRGFSITYFNQKTLRDPSILKEGDEVETVFSAGKIKSTITNIEQHD